MQTAALYCPPRHNFLVNFIANQSSGEKNTRDCRHCYAIGVRMFVGARSHQDGHFCFKFSLHYSSPCTSAVFAKTVFARSMMCRERKVKRVLFFAAERISTNIASGAHVDARNVKTLRALEKNYWPRLTMSQQQKRFISHFKLLTSHANI